MHRSVKAAHFSERSQSTIKMATKCVAIRSEPTASWSQPAHCRKLRGARLTTSIASTTTSCVLEVERLNIDSAPASCRWRGRATWPRRSLETVRDARQAAQPGHRLGRHAARPRRARRRALAELKSPLAELPRAIAWRRSSPLTLTPLAHRRASSRSMPERHQVDVRRPGGAVRVGHGGADAGGSRRSRSRWPRSTSPARRPQVARHGAAAATRVLDPRLRRQVGPADAAPPRVARAPARVIGVERSDEAAAAARRLGACRRDRHRRRQRRRRRRRRAP